ncbi:deoxyribose-phosphate aldolase [Flavobacteriaceae bacterium R38]|nr:deoxyribose-phosphate aldolase [Flavobacteriaceae bacterium R38]
MSCNTVNKEEKENDKSLTAVAIINNSIKASGGDTFRNAEISFDFRGRTYTSKRNSHGRELVRITTDSTGTQTKDVLYSNEFKRYINEDEVQVADSMVTRYSNSVNSVHYFAYLPQGLNDKAVHKELLGETTIKGTPYYKIKVYFDQEGGGTDFDDVFIYWVNKENYIIDYLAYEYHVDGGGIRLREAYNERFVEGLRFADHNNYKPAEASTKLEDMAKAFEEGKLKLLSKIELENVAVTLN